jgi:hypothetical protein
MPWPATLSITLCLFVLAPFFRKWIDLVVWPKVSDWWARRSIAAIKQQIRLLQIKVDYRPGLFSAFHLAIQRLFGVLSLLALCMAIHAGGDFASGEPSLTAVAWLKAHPGVAKLLRFSFHLLIASPIIMAWISAIDVKIAYLKAIGWEEYEAGIKERITALESKLAEMSHSE